jgi:anti-sigma factor RsiW
MPLVAAGAGAWTAAEREHLERCPSCAQEWRLVMAARHLGDREAARLDLEKLARGVTTGVETARRRARWMRAGWVAGLAAAAAVALLVWNGRGSAPREEAAGREHVLPVAELEDLDSTELNAVFEELEAPLGEVRVIDVPGLGGLNSQELERVLRSLEG